MAVHLVLIALMCAAVVEIALRMPIMKVAARAVSVGDKARRTVAAKRTSDHWKEKAMRAYAGAMVANTLALAGQLALVFVAVTGLVLIGERIEPGFFAFLAGPIGLAASVIVATAYYLGRRHVV